MATHHGGSRRSQLQDVTECPICCLRFERPLQLSCGHSFCGNCVDRLIADARGGNRNDIFPEQIRPIPAPNVDQGMNPPHFNRMEQEIWWPLNRPNMMPPPPGLGGIPHPPRYILRNFNDEPPFFPRRLLGGNGPGENIIKCPECRQPTRVPPEGLPVNYRLQELLSHVAEVGSQSADQSCSDGSRLRKCMACDDVISKGVYLLCRTCPGESVRQLCSMCCLRNHNGHDIEEKRFLTMQDVAVARDTVSEATGLGYQYVDLAIHELTTMTEATRDLLQLRSQTLLQEFENIVNDLQFELLSSNDELDNKVAAAKEISNRLEHLPRLIKGLTEEFHEKVTRVVNDFIDVSQGYAHDRAQNFDLETVDVQRDSNGSSTQNDTGVSGASTPLRPRRPERGEERLSISKTCALLERRARQRCLAQQQNAQRKRGAIARARIQEQVRQESYVPDQWTRESDRELRDRLREERRNGFFESDDHTNGRRLQKLFHNIANELSNHVSPRAPQEAEHDKRSRSVEVVAATPPAVVDLEQRAERLIISPQRRQNRNGGNISAETESHGRNGEKLKLKTKHRRGVESECTDEIDVVGTDFTFGEDPTHLPLHSSPLPKKRKYGVSNIVRYVPSPECPEPGPSSSFMPFSDGDRNNSTSSSTNSNVNSSSGDGTSEGEIRNVENYDETSFLG